MKKFFVIGNPIEHSLSPILHNYWIKNNGIDAIYKKQKLNENQLKEFVSQIREQKINGINVTIPFKKSVIPYLDELSIEARNTQSVNTIYFKNNKIFGHNTDIIVFETIIKKYKYDIINKEVFILGTWGVVQYIIFALIKMLVYKISVCIITK